MGETIDQPNSGHGGTEGLGATIVSLPLTPICHGRLPGNRRIQETHMLIRPFALIVLVSTLTVHVAAEQAATDGHIAEGRRWEMAEVRFQVDARPDSPTDIDFSAKFTSGKDLMLEVPGFYDGNGQYVVRFTPPEAGDWSYLTRSTLTALDRQTGMLSVAEAGDESKGAIIIPPDAPTRFRYQSGESYYPIAFECDWLFALDATNADDIPVTRKFIDQIAEDGFNQIVMNVFAYDVTWKKDASLRPEHEFGSPTVFPFGGNNEQPDHSRLNIEYFQRLDRVIEYLNERGIVAHLMIYVWNKRVNWPEANSAEDNRYFDYVVKRYQAYPNLVWDISKEALGYGHNDVHYITDRIERLRKLDAHRRMVTVHDYGYCRRFPDQLDFVSVQLWTSELYGVMRKTVETFPDKPILNIEHGGYERGPYRVFVGAYTSPETCLERAYQCVFAGTYPTHYWQGSAWNVIIPDIESLPATQRPKLVYYRHLADLVARYRFDELSAGKKHSNSGFCLTNNKDLFVYYVPKENEFMNLRMPKELRGKQMSGTWFDPFTGQYSDPIEKEVVQWPAFDIPQPGKFSVLIVEIEE